MTTDAVAIARRGVEAFNARDLDSATALLSDEVVWERFLSQTESDVPLAGPDAIRAEWESQIEAVDLRLEPEEFIPVGTDTVVMPTRMAARGSSSEMSLGAQVVWVLTVQDGRVTRARFFERRDEALRAAGA